MKKFTTLTVGDKEYKLRLTASAIMSIEKKLDKPLFTALENIQEDMVGTVIGILWGALQPLNSNMSTEKVYELFDDYIDEGNSIEDLMQVIDELFKSSGFFKKGQED